MSLEAALAFADDLVFSHTGRHLSDLHTTIIKQIWQGKKYVEIAKAYGCTEGHAKDVASLLWKLLSKVLEEKVTKTNLRSVLERNLQNISLTSTHFIGRNRDITQLSTLINQGNKIIVIQAEGGIGKTTLAQKYLEKQKFELVLELLMAKETAHITSVETIVEEWLKKDLNEEPGREFGISLGRLKRHLETRHIGILIDNLEPALDSQGMIIPSQRGYVELLRLLGDAKVQTVTLITSRDRLCEPALNLYHYRLQGLDLLTWEEYSHSFSLFVDTSTLKEMHKTYGGNAKAMGIICGVIKTDFAGNMQEYWQETQGDPLSEIDLKNLVSSQFNRLQTLDINAYNLLCRLGCYRYQDIPTIPTAGLLALLSDVEPEKRKQAIASLRHRSLIEYTRGKYWLHPVIRTEALNRLRSTDEWAKTNSQAAEFWTQSVETILTLQDAISAWEAYYHYLEIQDFELASLIILKPRKNQWHQFLPLGSTLYRMGLSQPVLTAISEIIDRIPSSSRRGELFNILGDLCCITGKIHQAIAYQEQAIKIASQGLKSIEANQENSHLIYYLKMLKIDSLLSIGLYQIDLGELQQARLFLNEVIKLSQNTKHSRWAQKASVCLALVKSYLGSKEEAKVLADSIYGNQQLFKNTGSFAYFTQILGQTYINLGEIAKATEILQEAITVAQKSHYPQVEGKALISLAQIDKRQNLLNLASTKQLKAIKILEEIGAKSDLAQAYYQLALTQQKKEYFDKALQLFTEIQAPKQVEKVLQASKAPTS